MFCHLHPQCAAQDTNLKQKDKCCLAVFVLILTERQFMAQETVLVTGASYIGKGLERCFEDGLEVIGLSTQHAEICPGLIMG